MQQSIFDIMFPKFKITKPIRLIECFAGYGSQALALKYLGVKFEHWKICEWAIKSIQAYKDAHYTNIDIEFNKDRTKEEIVEQLFKLGVSSDYNNPLTKEQLSRYKYDDLVTILKNIAITKNLVNICNVKGKDLEIVDTDKYEYIMTYSFPCQDLSLAGLGKGMARDSGTRSGMLWEVERILDECENLPQILLMENVPQVIGTDNVEHFNKWQLKLEQLGYKNYHQNLIATDYGIPQTRNRTFMISILGDYSYTFPQPIPLKLKLKDMLEDNVDEKYYLSDKMSKYIFSFNDKYKVNINSLKLDREIAVTKTTREGNTRADSSDYISDKVGNRFKLNTTNNSLIKTIEENEVKDTSFIDSYNKVIRDDYMAGTITTRVSDSNNTFIAIPEATKKGYAEALEGDGVYINRPHQKRGVVQKGKMQTLKTSPDTGVVDNLRIRKLTPKECFRLMGVKDEDYERIAKNQSDSSLYHLAGDSIVVNVLMAIFKELLNED